MKIRSIKCYHAIFNNSISIDFSKNGKDLNGMFCLHGGPNSGKSLLLNGVATRWSQHVFSNDDSIKRSALMDVEFDMDRVGLLSISRTSTPSANRQAFKDHSKITDSTIYGAIMYYPINRCFLSEESSFAEGSSSSGIFGICSDIRTRKIQNSTILIDDLDFKLNQNDFALLYRFLSNFTKNNNNQIIATVSSPEAMSFFDKKKRIELSEDTGIIEDIINGKIKINGY